MPENQQDGKEFNIIFHDATQLYTLHYKALPDTTLPSLSLSFSTLRRYVPLKGFYSLSSGQTPSQPRQNTKAAPSVPYNVHTTHLLRIQLRPQTVRGKELSRRFRQIAPPRQPVQMPPGHTTPYRNPTHQNNNTESKSRFPYTRGGVARGKCTPGGGGQSKGLVFFWTQFPCSYSPHGDKHIPIRRICDSRGCSGCDIGYRFLSHPNLQFSQRRE